MLASGGFMLIQVNPLWTPRLYWGFDRYGIAAKGLKMNWRRDRDSNPGYLAVYTLSKRAPSATRPSLRGIAGLFESNTVGSCPKAPSACFRTSGSLRGDVLFHDRGRFQIHRSALHKIASKRRGIAPVNLPSMIDSDQNVLSRNDVGQIEAAIRVRLVLA